MSKEPAKEKSSLGVTMTGSPDDGHRVTLEREDALQSIFGTKHPDTAVGLMTHCLKVLNKNEASDKFGGNDERKFMVAAVSEMKPRDAFESMLAVQMAATHVALIRQGGRMANAEQLPQFEAHERAYNKLARTYAAQVEALRKHRNGGKQTVRVERVHVHDGGQAIVGDVSTRGRVDGKK